MRVARGLAHVGHHLRAPIILQAVMTVIRTDHAPAPVGPYSQAVAHGGVVYCSGQIALDPASGELRTGTIERETELVLANVDAVLRAAGTDKSRVLKCSVFVRSMDDFARINAVYARYFVGSEPPARELVEVARLPKDVNIEISCIAALPA